LQPQLELGIEIRQIMEGQAIFECPNCGERFKSVDIDYRTSDHSIPMACPHCGTRTLDKAWNQTDIPDGWLITIIISCIIIPLVLWRGILGLLELYYRRLYSYKKEGEEEKESIIARIYHFFDRLFAHVK